MNIIFLMALLALMLSGVFVMGYIWAASIGQFDDLETPALRILKDDKERIKWNERIDNEN